LIFKAIAAKAAAGLSLTGIKSILKMNLD